MKGMNELDDGDDELTREIRIPVEQQMTGSAMH